MAYELRDYQLDIVNQIFKNKEENKPNNLVQSPPRTGKTVMMASVAKSYTDLGKKVLFIVHVKEVLNDAYSTFELFGVNMRKVEFLSPIKVSNRIKKDQFAEDHFDLIFIDEAHHSKAGSYMNIRNYFKPEQFLLFTATPIRGDGQGFEDIVDDIILGPKVDDLIKSGVLAKFDYFTKPLNNEEVLKVGSGGDYTNKSIEESVKNVDPEKVFQEYVKHGDNKQGLLYLARVSQSKEMADYFTKKGIPSAHVGGDTPRDERTRIVREYKEGKIKMVMNVGVFTEGVDLPSAEVAILLRPTKSLSLYLQFAMRVLTQKGDKHAKIIDLVGIAMNLGLPNYDFQWTLAASKGEESDFMIKNTMVACKNSKCEKTFYSEWAKIRSTLDDMYEYSCPYCGEVFSIISPADKIEEDEDPEEFYDGNPEIQKVDSKKDFMKKVYKGRQISENKSFHENYFTALYAKTNEDKEKAYRIASTVQGALLYSKKNMLEVGKNQEIPEDLIRDAIGLFENDLINRLNRMKYTYALDPDLLMQKILYSVLSHSIIDPNSATPSSVKRELIKLKNTSLAAAKNASKFEHLKQSSHNFYRFTCELSKDKISDNLMDIAVKVKTVFKRDFVENRESIILTEEDLNEYKKDLHSASNLKSGNIIDVISSFTRYGNPMVKIVVVSGGKRFYRNYFSQKGESGVFKLELSDWESLKRDFPESNWNQNIQTNIFIATLSRYVGKKMSITLVNEKYRQIKFN